MRCSRLSEHAKVGFFYGVIMTELTQEYLKECFDYNPETGDFVWKERPLHHFKDGRAMKIWNTKYAGLKSGSLQKRGYIEISLSKKAYTAHRLAWLYVFGEMPKDQIDHINSIKTDNKINNLRESTNSQNAQNKVKCNSNNKSSGMLGVSFDKRYEKYAAQITVNGKYKLIGRFNNKDDAHNAYLKAKRSLHEFNTL